jgi:hypothetical protein
MDQVGRHIPFTCLINAEQPEQPHERIHRKAFLDPVVLTEFVLRGLLLRSHGTIEVDGSLRLVPAPFGVHDHIRDSTAWNAAYIPYLALEYDGETAHCISLFGTDPKSGGIVFYHSWPGPSLLTREQNIAGVTAMPVLTDTPFFRDRRLCLWRISPEEFARVVYAVFVPTVHWEQLM